MRKHIKIVTVWLIVFIVIDSSFLFCLHSTEFNIEFPIENVIKKTHNEEKSHMHKHGHHDPFHDVHHYTLNTVDTSVKIDSPLSGTAFIPESSQYDISAAVFYIPLLYLQQKFKFPTVKSRLHFISSLLI